MAETTLGALSMAWKRWLFDDALPLWASAGVNPATGAFEEAIGWDGAFVPAPLRARVQARQVYVFATAGALGWPGPWRERLQGGLDFIAHYRRPDGLYRTKVDRAGSPVDDTPVLYDQAFFLFAAAAAARLAPAQEAALEADALAHLNAVERHFRHPSGGFWEADADRPFQSNAHMHLLEAMLAWEELTGRPRWRDAADRIVELCLDRFIDRQSGALREFFDAIWSPAPGELGRIVEPGHQFEWAWLLKRWADKRGHAEAVTAARRLFEIGVTHGVDAARGVAFNALDDGLAPLDPVARLWPQTERVKAALSLAGDDRDAQVAAACAGLQRYIKAAPRGLWRDRLKPDDAFVDEPAPASSFYHIVCALNELFAAADAFSSP
ncbi:AGE family epimerase/isomerase [Caulobacter sp. S45]|uniref:AGE family epimerase/isomerase n=1 Tax=Caulobacter sp. S45 TaxID=1641861 RepID=UPI001576BB6A|nr:AGE family epimerase/isomerase [Caulobacter sp. S45]